MNIKGLESSLMKFRLIIAFILILMWTGVLSQARGEELNTVDLGAFLGVAGDQGTIGKGIPAHGMESASSILVAQTVAPLPADDRDHPERKWDAG
jgi:hypothetical protein